MNHRRGTELQQKLVDDCCQWLKADDRILAAWLVGSLAQRTGDRFSDIDLYVVVRDAYYDAVFSERETLARRFGDVLSTFEVEWPNCQMLGVILKNGIEIDLCYCRLDQCGIFKPNCRYRILFDRSGQLEERLRKPVIYEDDPIEDIRDKINSSNYHFLHAIHSLARNDLWVAIYHVQQLRTILIDLLARRMNADFSESKRLGQYLDAKDSEQLQQTLCRYDTESIRQAIETLIELFKAQLESLSLKYEIDLDIERLSHWNHYLQVTLSS